ncbi:diguanylate cyclase [Alteromonadaceae bacterium BrNp21-10]|nr:diguanylate cyclase [Alteromonadaceae bacterium BrNp21-10]
MLIVSLVNILKWLMACRKPTLVLLLFCYCASSFAVSNFPTQVKFNHILSSELEKIGYIHGIAQDQDGFMWFAALQGLARYDGYKLKIFRHDPQQPKSLSHNWVKSIVNTSRGQMWAVSHLGLCLYIAPQENFQCATIKDNQQKTTVTFSTLFEDSEGQFWVSTSLGLKMFDPVKRVFTDVPSKLAALMAPIENREDNFVEEITEDQSGNLWFGLMGNGLVRYHQHSGEITHFVANAEVPGSLASNKILDVYIDSKNTLWIGTLGQGVQYFNPDSNSFIQFIHNESEKAEAVWNIVEDHQGMYWIGDGTGVHIYDPQLNEVKNYIYKEGLQGGPGNFVGRYIYIDSSDNLWIGYFPSGVDMVDPTTSQFHNYIHDPANLHSLADGGVLTTLEDGDGNLWVGSGFGLNFLNRQTQQFTRYVHDDGNANSISGSTVLDIAQQDDGILWIGSWDRGLNRLDPKTMKFKHYIENEQSSNSLLGREPWSILVDDQQQLWVGTEKGVNRYQPQSDDFKEVMPNNEQGAPVGVLYTRQITQLSSGLLWLATFNGVYVLDPLTDEYQQHYAHNSQDSTSLSNDQVLSIFEDSHQQIWIGTNGAGLNLFNQDEQTFRHFGLDHGLPDLVISSIIESPAGELWVSTFQGLARFDRQTETFRVFDKGDGLLGNLFNRNSASLLSSGELVFGSSRGLSIFDPTTLRPNNNIPPVVLTDFSIFNKSVKLSDDGVLKSAINKTNSISLDHTQSMFSFEFAALDFKSPEENQFAYRLLGFEEQWNEVGNKRTATYTNLDAGDYLFQVKASNNDGVWNEHPTEIKLIIYPPIWKTPQAYAIYTLLVLSLLYRVVRVQQSKMAYSKLMLQKERAIVRRLEELDQMKDEVNQDLDKKVAERTEELKKEHHRLLQMQEELHQVNKKLEEASVTDPLTGLKNRRYLRESIETDIAMVVRDYRELNAEVVDLNDLTFIVLDIDYFKVINDQYGHAGGDAILIQMSELLKEQFRTSDFLIRWGGEEFVIVIRHIPREMAKTSIARFHQAIQRHAFYTESKQQITVSCSMGAAALPFYKHSPELLSWEQVINIADRAMYCAKESGRNCWVWLDDDKEQRLQNHPYDYASFIDNIHNHVKTGLLQVESSMPVNNLVWNRSNPSSSVYSFE